MTNNLEDEVKRIVAGMDNQESQESKQEELQDIYVLIVREHEEAEDQTRVRFIFLRRLLA